MSFLRSTSVSVMRPPKPPCWRDFVISTPKSINSEGVDVVDPTGRPVGSRSPVADLMETSRGSSSLPGNKPSRLARRPRAKIHRTRSEHIIHAEDLPESAFTATLADADPKGVRVRVPDGRLYVEENNRRCQSWLASIEAAEPLDEVGYTSEQRVLSTTDTATIYTTPVHDDLSQRCARHPDSELIPIHELQQGVDVEIPEETFVWDACQHSPCSGEEVCITCQKISPHHVDNKESSGTPPCSRNESATRSHRGLTDNISKNRRFPACDTGERPGVENAATVAECGQKSCGEKLYKLCCDHHQATKSLSHSQNNTSHYRLGVDGGDLSKMSAVGDKVADVSSSNSCMTSPDPPPARSQTTHQFS